MVGNDSFVLICTVGGSPQPVITAINTLRPVHTEFICTGNDPGTGQPGSCITVTGSGMVCKLDRTSNKPDSPNIPTITGINEDQFAITIVPSDDLDGAFLTIRKKLIELDRQFPDAMIMADYTAGTKTMTAALVTAVLETENIALQLVTGNRPDLVKVRNDTQAVVSASIDSLRYEKSVKPFLRCWERYAYDEAAKGLSDISPPRDTQLRNNLFRIKDVSNAFAAWDRFDHGKALKLIGIYDRALGNKLGPYLGVLKILTVKSQKQDPMLILDLWNNANRRADQGRYDDAVARCYRMIEWTAQWILQKTHDINTSNLSPDFVPPELDLHPNTDGKLQAGLMKAWELIGLKNTGPAGDFFHKQGKTLLNRIKLRNRSILAHGNTPIGEETWREMANWMADIFIPMLLEETASVGIRKAPLQLPRGAANFLYSS